MKSQILVIAYQTGHSANGGIESATQIAEAISSNFRLTLSTNRHSQFTKRWKACGAAVHVSPFDNLAGWLSRNIQAALWALAILRILAFQRPSVVHVNDILSYRILSFLPKSFRRNLVFTLRGRSPDEPFGKIWTRLARDVSRLVVLSDEMGEQIVADLKVDPAKVIRVSSIVDLERFSPADAEERRQIRSSLGISDGEIAIGLISVVRDIKGQLPLIEQAVPVVCSAVPNARFHFIGDFDPAADEYSARVQAAVSANGLSERVVFHGHQSSMDPWYKALDILTIASRFEGLARAMIEGMASELPVVSFDVCSATEMLHETGAGAVVKRGEFGRLAQEIIDIAHDQHKRRIHGKAGREVAVEKFSRQEIAARYSQLYTEVAH